MLSDWESDLTDLSSDEDDVSPPKVKDEDEYVPSSIKKKARATTTTKDLGSDYKILNALRPPRTTQYTAKSLFDQIIENTIDLDPEYQRDVVWPDTKQSGLIDSILRNYYIPPVIFAVTAREDGSELRTCIDGKQRLTSIASFFNGLIPHKDSKTNTRYWYTQNAGKGPRRKILPRQYQQAFANKQITCVEYETLSNDQEREIFQRVQLGVALTPAERLQALTGTRPTLVRQIQQKILGDNGFGSDLEWANGRGRDFQCLASIVYLIEQETDTFPGVSVLERWLTSINALPVKFEHNIMETFTIWVNLVRDKAYNMPFSKPTKVSPIEFTLIGLLIHKHKTSLSPMQLSNAIWAMRADVRKVHVDIRANTKVTKTMLAFINRKIKTLDLGQFDFPANAMPKTKATTSGTKISTKRKRVESSSEEEVSESESDDDDEDDVPLRRKAPAKKKAATANKASSSKTSTTATKSAAAKTSTTTKTTAKSSPVAKAPKPSTSASTSKLAANNSRVTVKQVAMSASTKSVKTSSVSQAVSKKPTSGLSSSATSTPVATPTIPSQGTPSTKKSISTSGGTTSSPIPLALPRRTAIATGAAGNGRSVSMVIKAEPMPDAALPSPTAAHPETTPPTNDRLAVLRAAKATAGGRSFSGGSPVVPASSQASPAGNTSRMSPQNILDNVAPMVKQEKISPPNINTDFEMSLQQASAAYQAPSSSTSSRLPTPALPPPSARSTPAVSTPTPGPAPPPVHIQQANGQFEIPQSDGSHIDVASIEALLKQHGIGTKHPLPQSQWKPAFSAATLGSSTPEDVKMADATSRQGTMPMTMSTEQAVALVSSMPPHLLSILEIAKQTASASPGPGVTPTAFSAAPATPNTAMKRSSSTPAVVPPSMPAAMRTPPPAGWQRPHTEANGSVHALPPPPTTLPPPPPNALPPPLVLPPFPPTLPATLPRHQTSPIPPRPVSPTLGAKSIGTSSTRARPMTERDDYGSNGNASSKSSRSRWDDRDDDWDMDRGRDREREWSREYDREREMDWSPTTFAERSRDPRRRDSGGMRDWERERSERDYDYDRSRSWGGRGRGRGRGWARAW